MDHPSVQLAAAKDPNQAIRIARNIQYTGEIWYFTACLIFIVSSWHLVSRLWTLIQTRSKLKCISSEQQVSDASSSEGSRTPRLATSVSLRRLPLAATSVFRIVVFRSTLKLGSLFIANLAEIAVMTSYLVAALVWSFINSKLTIHHHTPGLYVKSDGPQSSERNNAPEFRRRLLG